MQYITNINPILDKTIIELIEDYYYNYDVNVQSFKFDSQFNIPLSSYIHKPIKDCSIGEICYSGDKHNVIYYIICKYQIDIRAKTSALPTNISLKHVYDMYKNDIIKLLQERPCDYYRFIHDNYVNNPKIDMNNFKCYILYLKFKYLEDKFKYLDEKNKILDDSLRKVNLNILRIFYLIFCLFIYYSISVLWIIK